VCFDGDFLVESICLGVRLGLHLISPKLRSLK
jgi:hypothetical protein